MRFIGKPSIYAHVRARDKASIEVSCQVIYHQHILVPRNQAIVREPGIHCLRIRQFKGAMYQYIKLQLRVSTLPLTGDNMRSIYCRLDKHCSCCVQRMSYVEKL